MIVVRAAGQRGRTRRDGVDCQHAFSAGDFHDAAWMGWGVLRVLDEIVVAPGAGFAPQRRANMEILSYVIDGALLHRDGDGVDRAVTAGTLQCVGAGAGIEVDERNASATTPLRMLRAWLQPDRVNAPPRRVGMTVDPATSRARWTTLASSDGVDGSAAIRQAAWLRLAVIGDRQTLALDVDAARRYWVQVLRGDVTVDARALAAGDALAVVDEAGALQITASGSGDAELIAFDLPR